MALKSIKTPYQPNQLAQDLNDNFADLEGRIVEPDDLTPYQLKITANGLLKGDGSGGVTPATAGTDYITPTQLADKLGKDGGTMTGAIAMGGNKITDLGAPTDAADAVTKQYVDNGLAQLNGFRILGGTAASALTTDFDANGEPISTGDTKAITAISNWLTDHSHTAANKDALTVVFNITGVEEQRTWLYAFNGTTWNHQYPMSEVRMANGSQAGIVEGGGDVEIANGVITIKTTWIPAKATAIDGVAAAGNKKYYGTDASGTPGFYSVPDPGSTLTKLQFTSADEGWTQSVDVWSLSITSSKDPVAVYKEISTGVYRFVQCDVEKNSTAVVVSALEKFTGYVIMG